MFKQGLSYLKKHKFHLVLTLAKASGSFVWAVAEIVSSFNWLISSRL